MEVVVDGCVMVTHGAEEIYNIIAKVVLIVVSCHTAEQISEFQEQ
jgi:hypothetical protein